MIIKQVSIFVENRPGSLQEITAVLKDHDIDIRALSIADTTDFGILRMIVGEPEKAAEILNKAGFMVSVTSVVAVGLEDKPGALHGVLEILYNEGISVEYAYAFITRKSDGAYVILRVEDIQRAAEALKKGGVRVICSEELYSI
jgi:hypothetical protein